MFAGNDPLLDSAVRTQEAVVRALTEALEHLDPGSPAAASLRIQLVEESGRLAFRLDAVHANDGCQAPGRAHEPAAAAQRAPRVLIVEDDDGTRTALARWLSVNYEVVTAQDGEQGFALATADPPDVIVTDLWMPRLDGISMVNRLKRAASSRAIPVIFLTGQPMAESTRDRILAVAVAYLSKPLDLDVIEQAVHEALTHPGAHH